MRSSHRRRWSWGAVGLFCLALPLCLGSPARAQTSRPLDFARSHWISTTADGQPQAVAFRRAFDLPAEPAVAQLRLTADGAAEISLNGEVVGQQDDWQQPQQYDLRERLRTGRNVLGIRLSPTSDHPAVLAVLRAVMDDGAVVELVSDPQWRVTADPVAGWAQPDFDDAAWPAASDLGAYGEAPWGRLTVDSGGATAHSSTDEPRGSVTQEPVVPTPIADAVATLDAAPRAASQSPVRQFTDPQRGYTLRHVGARVYQAVGPDGSPRPTPPLPPAAVEPPAGMAPADYLSVGDFYRSRGEFARAAQEYRRLMEVYPDSEIQRLAAVQLREILLDSGAFVAVNHSPVTVTFDLTGAGRETIVVGPGEERTAMVPAGPYVAHVSLAGGGVPVLGLPLTTEVDVEAGDVALVQFSLNRTGASTEATESALNVRGPLSPAETEALKARALAMLPGGGAAAAGGAPGAGAGGEAPVDELAAVAEVPLVTEMDVNDPRRAEQETRVQLRNQTEHDVRLTLGYAPPAPNPGIEEVVLLPPGGTYRVQLPREGNFSAYGELADTGQKFHFGVQPSTGQQYDLALKQLTEREVERQRERGGNRRLQSSGGQVIDESLQVQPQ